jgi:hypothetical protein
VGQVTRFELLGCFLASCRFVREDFTDDALCQLLAVELFPFFEDLAVDPRWFELVSTGDDVLAICFDIANTQQ